MFKKGSKYSRKDVGEIYFPGVYPITKGETLSDAEINRLAKRSSMEHS